MKLQLMTEYAELAQRIINLEELLDSAQPADSTEFALLTGQLDAMRAYWTFLTLRLEAQSLIH
jgi:hypothetical protein